MRASLKCLLFVYLAVASLVPPAAIANDPKPYEATSHRKFDDVGYWSGVFDDPERASWQNPSGMIQALSLVPGMAVADIGAGTGFFSRSLSRAVGPDGVVFAVEIEPTLVDHLRIRAEKEATTNVVPVLASLDNPRLPAGAIDVVLLVDTYHHIDDRRPYLERVLRSLKRDGRVAIVDWKPGELPVGPKEESHKIPRTQVIEEMRGAGFEVAAESEILEYQYFLIFRRISTPVR